MRASGNPSYLADGPWGQMVAMVDSTFRMLSTGASWSGNERNHLFLGRPGEADFTRVTGISGLDDMGDTMSAAMLDYDRDGWTDVVLGNISRPRLRLMRNRVAERLASGANGFVALRFVGGNHGAEPRPGWSARDALGVRVELGLGDGRVLHRELRRNDGFKAQHSSTLLVGLGEADSVGSLHVHWPSGRELELSDVPSGVLVTLYEDPQQSPSGEASIVESYAPEESTRTAALDVLRIPGAHGERGLTVYTTMSTTCAGCARAQPDLRALREAFGDGELTLVGIPVSPDDTESLLREYVERKHPAYAVQIGQSEQVTARVRETVAASLHGEGNATPASIITDANGRILKARWGVPTLSELRRLAADAGR